MNVIFERYGDKTGNKPNIYFPLCATELKFQERMKTYKITMLEHANPRLYDTLQSPQPYRAGEKTWWPQLHTLARRRHEEFPRINPGSNGGIGFGRGQNISLRNVSFRPGHISIGEAHAWNQNTGTKEALNVNFIEAIKDELAGTGEDPISFINSCASQLESLLKMIGTRL
ncbi:hypothetical protein GOD96_12745 [Sinorhizobium medicae]|nr:hypothetical protein [Sinorhizobium medicae]